MRYPKAPVGARLLASIVDGLLAGIPLAAAGLFVVFVLVPTAPAGARGSGTGGLGGMIAGGLLVAAAAVWMLWYTHVKDGMPHGQSYGKRWTGLMVVHLPDHQPCTRWQSAVRKLVWAGLMAIPILGWLVEPIAAILDADGRRLGDRAAGTQVIERRAYRRTPTAAAATGALGAGAVDPYEDAVLREAQREVDEITRRGR